MLQNKISKKSALLSVAAVAIATSVGVGTLSYVNATHADTSTGTSTNMKGEMRGGHGVMGTVSAVSGNTLTVTSASTTYAVDVSSAKLLKVVDITLTKGSGTSAISVSGISTGDKVMVEGTVTGTSVVATTVVDGQMPMPPMGGRGFGPGMGEDQGVMGTISAINGSSVTVAGQNATSYTVDASSAKIEKDRTIITVTGLTVGDHVVVKGTVSGTSVVASDIIDGMGFGGGRGGPKGQAPLPTTTPQS